MQVAFAGHGGFEAPQNSRGRMPISMRSLLDVDGDDGDDDGGEDGGEDDDVRPAPPSVGADVPVTYFGASPSQKISATSGAAGSCVEVLCMYAL